MVKSHILLKHRQKVVAPLFLVDVMTLLIFLGFLSLMVEPFWSYESWARALPPPGCDPGQVTLPHLHLLCSYEEEF